MAGFLYLESILATLVTVSSAGAAADWVTLGVTPAPGACIVLPVGKL